MTVGAPVTPFPPFPNSLAQMWQVPGLPEPIDKKILVVSLIAAIVANRTADPKPVCHAAQNQDSSINPFSSTRHTVCQVSKVKVKGLGLDISYLA